MQVQKISFTSAEQPQKKESALYSKRGYMSQLYTDQFIIGTISGYGLLETIDKFKLISNKKNLSAKALKKKAWKHTKYNLLGGIATGIATLLVGKFFTNKYIIPIAEKAFDNLEKQERINAKVKELVEQENKPQTDKPETKEIEETEETKEPEEIKESKRKK